MNPPGVAMQALARTVADLDERRHTPAVPTADAYLPRVLGLCPPKTLKSYRPHLVRLGATFHGVRLDKIGLPDLRRERGLVARGAAMSKLTRAAASGRELRSWDPDAHGYGAAENYVRATRFFFACAVEEGLLTGSVAARLRSPHRPPAPERPLEPSELSDLWRVATTTGNDTQLDELLVLLARHLAARREGLINLRLGDLDDRRGIVTLTEKGGKVRDLPLHRDLVGRARRFAHDRGAAAPSDSVLRYRNGDRLTGRRFDYLFNRLDTATTWSQRLDVGIHWVRHTTLADIATVAGLRVAAAFAGHSDASLGVIGLYTKVPPEDLRAAYEAVFGPDRSG
jgi:site-specific recombinase XerD